MNKTYILQKDLPCVSEGTEFQYDGKLVYRPVFKKLEGSPPDDYFDKSIPRGMVRYPKIEYDIMLVENNPEWFKLKEQPKEEEKMVISDITQVAINSPIYTFTFSRVVPSEKFPALSKMIESMVNKNAAFNEQEPYAQVKEKLQQKYTEEDMRKCFEESRLTHPMVGFKHSTFEDYINSLNK